jgi:hypothetical protein
VFAWMIYLFGLRLETGKIIPKKSNIDPIPPIIAMTRRPSVCDHGYVQVKKVIR